MGAASHIWFVFFLKSKHIHGLESAFNHCRKNLNYFDNEFSICQQWCVFQSIVVPREDWYWPKTESNDEEDDENTEEQDAEENIDLTVSSTS